MIYKGIKIVAHGEEQINNCKFVIDQLKQDNKELAEVILTVNSYKSHLFYTTVLHEHEGKVLLARNGQQFDSSIELCKWVDANPMPEVTDINDELMDAETCDALLSAYIAGDIEAVKRVISKFTPVELERIKARFEATLWYDRQDEAGENNSEEDYKQFLALFEPQNKYHALCDNCGAGMNAGYIVTGGKGQDYYCSDACLHAHYTPEQWAEMSAEEEDETNDENYYTEWEDKEDMFFDENDANLKARLIRLSKQYNKSTGREAYRLGNEIREIKNKLQK